MLSALPVLILSSANSCNHGKCVATGTSYVCKCAEGYGGATCDHKNDSSTCSTFKCHQGQCHFSDRGEPYCLCQPGFSGEHCEQGGSTVCRGGGPEKTTGGRAGLHIQTADSPEFSAWRLHDLATLLSKLQFLHLEHGGNTLHLCSSRPLLCN